VWQFYQDLQTEFDKLRGYNDRLTYAFNDEDEHEKDKVTLIAGGITTNVDEALQKLLKKHTGKAEIEALMYKKEGNEQIYTFKISAKARRDKSPERIWGKVSKSNPYQPVKVVPVPSSSSSLSKDSSSNSEGDEDSGPFRRSKTPMKKRAKPASPPPEPFRRSKSQSITRSKIVKMDADEAEKLKPVLQEKGTRLREIKEPKKSGGLFSGLFG
jgi:hypothetical protein